MNKSNFSPAPARTWRDIPQQVKPRAMSNGGRRRLMMACVRGSMIALGIVVLLGGVYFFAEMWQGETRTLSRAVNAVPIKEIALRTDGVLDQAWITRTLALSPKATLMDLDIGQLHARLLADPQVVTATVARKFPATLEVSLAERVPVALVNARIGSEEPRPYLVARDGTVYRGSGYDQTMLGALPWLDGVKLRLNGDHFEPIPGMIPVADLLATARNEAPHLYRSWKVVSLARLESDAEIQVRATNIEKVIFSARSSVDFLRQIAQLDVLLDSVHAAVDQPVNEINLAVGRMVDGRIQVPVTFKEPLAEPTHAPVAAPNNSFFKTNRPASREL